MPSFLHPLVLACTVLLAAASIAAAAEGGAATPPVEQPQESEPAVPVAPDATDPTGAMDSGEQAGLPDTPAERARVLESLYAHLATAEGEDAAQLIAGSIERIWLHSGSDTIGLLMERAIKAAEEKNYDLALKLLDAVVELAPDYAEGWNRRALVYYLRDELALALGDLRRALALEPNHFKALDGLAQILREMGEKKAALKALHHLLSVHPFWPREREHADLGAGEVEAQGM